MHKRFSNRIAIAILPVALSLLVGGVFVARATVYQPGATLNPDCAPGSSNCGVTSLTILTNGNVGIGTTSPSTALEVNGSITLGGGGTLLQTVPINGNRRLFSSQNANATKGPFGMTIGTTLFNSTQDEVMYFGYNADVGGGNILGTEPRFSWQVENDYEASPGVHYLESYFEWRNAAGTQQLRPIFMQINRATGNMNEFDIQSNGIIFKDWLTGANMANLSAGGVGFALNGNPAQSADSVLMVGAQNGKYGSLYLGGGFNVIRAGSQWYLATNSQPLSAYGYTTTGTGYNNTGVASTQVSSYRSNWTITNTDNNMNVISGIGITDVFSGGTWGTNYRGVSVTPTDSGSLANQVTGLFIDLGGVTNVNTTKYAATFNGGNVGIGKVSPAASLDIKAAANVNPFNVASSSGTSVMVINSQGNVGIGTSTPTLGPLTMASGAYVTTGGTWTNASDRHLKENFTTVTPTDILQKIDALPITQWNYKAEDASITHIGPVAQDFYAAFGLGGEAGKTSISTIDPAGVALLGIKALDQKIAALQGSLTGNVTATSLSVYAPSNFSGDSVGEARILAGQTSVRVTFRQAYAHQPIVTITPEDFLEGLQVRVTGKEAAGFTIELNATTTSELTFDWHSFASPDEQLTVSDGTTQNIALVVATASPASLPPAISMADPSSVSGSDPQPALRPESATATPTTELATSTPAVDAATSTQIFVPPSDSTPAPETVTSNTPTDSSELDDSAAGSSQTSEGSVTP